MVYCETRWRTYDLFKSSAKQGEREVLGAQDRGAAQDSLNFTSQPT